MQDDSKFTPEQKAAVRKLALWQNVSHHSNGDISVRAGGTYYRFNKQGILVERKGGAWPDYKKPVQGSLSDDLTSELTGKPIHTTSKPKGWPVKKGDKLEFDYSGSYSKYSNPKPYISQTICQEYPECCKPREIKGVFWDADHTIWDLTGTAAAVTGRLEKIDDNTVVEYWKTPYKKEKKKSYTLSETEKQLLVGLSEKDKEFLLGELSKEHGVPIEQAKPEPEEVRTTIKLDPTFRGTLDKLEQMGIPSYIISLNTPGSVKRILETFGLADRFKVIRDSYDPKGMVFKELTHKDKICACNGLFVDDARSNTAGVANACGMAIQIGKGKDIEKTDEIFKYIKQS